MYFPRTGTHVYDGRYSSRTQLFCVTTQQCKLLLNHVSYNRIMITDLFCFNILKKKKTFSKKPKAITFNSQHRQNKSPYWNRLNSTFYRIKPKHRPITNEELCLFNSSTRNSSHSIVNLKLNALPFQCCPVQIKLKCVSNCLKET